MCGNIAALRALQGLRKPMLWPCPISISGDIPYCRIYERKSLERWDTIGDWPIFAVQITTPSIRIARQGGANQALVVSVRRNLEEMLHLERRSGFDRQMQSLGLGPRWPGFRLSGGLSFWIDVCKAGCRDCFHLRRWGKDGVEKHE